MNTYSTKRDTTYFFLYLLLLGVVFSGYFFLKDVIHTLSFYLVLYLLIHKWLYTQYTLNTDHLMIQSGWSKYRIPIESIIKISKTHDYQWTTALAKDKLILFIDLNGKERQLFISPKDKETFIYQLRLLNNNIIIDD